MNTVPSHKLHILLKSLPPIEVRTLLISEEMPTIIFYCYLFKQIHNRPCMTFSKTRHP